jgi:DNA-binding CsgD family transcriptional regulator
VLTLAAQGQTTPEIATTLGIDPHLVRTRIASAIVKLNAVSKLDAVMRAARAGEIDLS